MSDFTTTLREQLVDAAAREQARRVPRISLPAARVLVAGAVGAALLAFVVVAVAGGLRSEPVVTDRPPPPADERGGRELFGGSLEAGVRYRTRAFVPTLSFVPGDGQWFVRDATQPGFLALERRPVRTERGEGPPGGGLFFTYLPEVYDPEVPKLQASRTVAPRDLHDWFADHPDLVVTSAEPVTVGGVPGTQFYATTRFRRPAHPLRFCLDPTLPRRLQPCTQLAPNAAFPRGTELRITVLRTEPDPLVLALITFPWGNLDEGPADELLASLRVGIR